MKRGDKIRATRFDGTVFEGIATEVLSEGTNVEFFNGDVDLFAAPEGDYWSNGWTFEVLESHIAVGDVIDAERLKELPVGSLVKGILSKRNALVTATGMTTAGGFVGAFPDFGGPWTVLFINTPED